MRCRRLIVASLFAVPALLGAVACTVQGAGTKTDCQVSGCTVTFDRGVNAKASVLGMEAKVVAVEGNTVTLDVAGQRVSTKVGETQPANGASITVQEVTGDKVVVRIATGINS